MYALQVELGMAFLSFIGPMNIEEIDTLYHNLYRSYVYVQLSFISAY